MISRYDLELGLILLAFVVSAIVSIVADPSLEQTLVPAAVVGILVIIDACYLNPPINEEYSS
ncbi:MULTISPECIES: hypothetical protein [Natrialbaceae]|uniref:hypothetical protein n=1 Tax=Natrialbaceae TaxID=1644061 RepID=UPI00207CF049|nr:hypothetical protein [Natronococcus sp. CG52]